MIGVFLIAYLDPDVGSISSFGILSMKSLQVCHAMGVSRTVVLFATKQAEKALGRLQKYTRYPLFVVTADYQSKGICYLVVPVNS